MMHHCTTDKTPVSRTLQDSCHSRCHCRVLPLQFCNSRLQDSQVWRPNATQDHSPGAAATQVFHALGNGQARSMPAGQEGRRRGRRGRRGRRRRRRRRRGWRRRRGGPARGRVGGRGDGRGGCGRIARRPGTGGVRGRSDGRRRRGRVGGRAATSRRCGRCLRTRTTNFSVTFNYTLILELLAPKPQWKLESRGPNSNSNISSPVQDTAWNVHSMLHVQAACAEMLQMKGSAAHLSGGQGQGRHRPSSCGRRACGGRLGGSHRGGCSWGNRWGCCCGRRERVGAHYWGGRCWSRRRWRGRDRVGEREWRSLLGCCCRRERWRKRRRVCGRNGRWRGREGS